MELILMEECSELRFELSKVAGQTEAALICS